MKFLSANAQQSANSAGGEAYGNNGTVSYSIGQVNFQSLSGTDGSIIEGVQQPYEIYTVGLSKLNSITLSVYPNPLINQLTLQIDDADVNRNLNYILLDNQGKVIEENKINSSKTIISGSNLASGIYYVNIVSKNEQLQSFKIVKN
ncbi:MAG: T9SS type A sorting domain-containing protein [Bacteroidota bacterium]